MCICVCVCLCVNWVSDLSIAGLHPTTPQLAEGIMVHLWRDFWIRKTGTSQQVAQLHERYMTMMMMMMMTKYPSFCMTTFSQILTNFTVLLPQSHDCSCYVSRPILAPPSLWLLKHNALRAHDFAHSPDLWHQPRLANFTCAWSWRLCAINPATTS